MSLQALRQHPGLWRGSELPAVRAEPTGFPSLDAIFPGGGWPVGALTEIITTKTGIGELRLLLPVFSRLSRSERWLAWISPPCIPYAPALAAAGVDLSKMLLIHPEKFADRLWAAEQALRSGACSAVLAWTPGAGERALRRLQLAAEAGECCAFVFDRGGVAPRPSPAALRLQIEPAVRGISVRVLKRRGPIPARPTILELGCRDPEACG